MIYALAAAIDVKDHYTFSYSNDVSYYATSLAEELKLNSGVVEIIRQAALLHDVGKIGISEAILNKEGKLTEEEYETIKGHERGKDPDGRWGHRRKIKGLDIS